MSINYAARYRLRIYDSAKTVVLLGRHRTSISTGRPTPRPTRSERQMYPRPKKEERRERRFGIENISHSQQGGPAPQRHIHTDERRWPSRRRPIAPKRHPKSNDSARKLLRQTLPRADVDKLVPSGVAAAKIHTGGQPRRLDRFIRSSRLSGRSGWPVRAWNDGSLICPGGIGGTAW